MIIVVIIGSIIGVLLWRKHKENKLVEPNIRPVNVVVFDCYVWSLLTDERFVFVCCSFLSFPLFSFAGLLNG